MKTKLFTVEEAVEELSWLQSDGTVSPKAKEQLERLQEEQKQQEASFEKVLRERRGEPDPVLA